MYIYTYESVCNIMYLNICLIKRLSVFNNFVFDLCNFGEKRLAVPGLLHFILLFCISQEMEGKIESLTNEHENILKRLSKADARIEKTKAELAQAQETIACLQKQIEE